LGVLNVHFISTSYLSQAACPTYMIISLLATYAIGERCYIWAHAGILENILASENHKILDYGDDKRITLIY